eukprot:TRINITY_DN13168_c0_g1_i2.p3 TRINITY_DN13168_c0_g1~~TRINITY_DN13168_c0_g1_i2.p3  ORF type:complete len:115 (+),score=14.82 TRINITY_DN13168_c0_g1_i2:98-442(+)
MVTLSYVHARDANLQMSIASSDQKLVDIISRGDRVAGALHEAQSSCASSSSSSAAAGQQTLPRQGSPASDADGATAAKETEGWLERMQRRDAEMQARIAAGDARVKSAVGFTSS